VVEGLKNEDAEVLVFVAEVDPRCRGLGAQPTNTYGGIMKVSVVIGTVKYNLNCLCTSENILLYTVCAFIALQIVLTLYYRWKSSLDSISKHSKLRPHEIEIILVTRLLDNC